MAIIVNLDVMLARRKMSLSELSERVDISIVNLSVLKTGKAKAIRFSTWRPSAVNSIANQPIFWNIRLMSSKIKFRQALPLVGILFSIVPAHISAQISRATSLCL